MQAEIIAIGDELTSGQRLDTNSRWISQQLGDIGVPVHFHTSVGDDLEKLVQAFRAAFDRSDYIFCTGGLGPTDDDLTREAIAAALGVQLQLDESSLEHIQSIFKKYQREMPERNRKQALLPLGSQPIPNPEGTAPGVMASFERDGKPPSRLFALPGIPAELHQMWAGTVQPALLSGRPQQIIRHRVLKCFGTGESQLESMLPNLIQRGRDPAVGITVHQATITLRVTTSAESIEACDEKMEPTIRTIRESLGTLVFGEEEDELQHSVVRLLRVTGHTLTTVELGTSGLIAHWLGELSEFTPCYRGGLVAHNAETLAQLLGQPAELVADLPSVSAEMAAWLAKTAQQTTGADYALATSAFPHRRPDQTDTPKFYAAVATPTGVQTHTIDFTGHSAILYPRAAKQTLNKLRLHLLEKNGSA